MHKVIKAILLTISFVVLFSSCNRNENAYITETQIKMDTVCTIKIYDNLDKENLKNAFKIIQDIDEKFSNYNENSEISKINQNAGVASIKVDKDIKEVLEVSTKYGEMSNGILDITINPLSKLWKDSESNLIVPEDYQIKETLNFIDYRNILINENEVMIPSGYSLDLGAIVKGYAADKVKEYLISKNVNSALINLGGNILAIGENINDKEFKIGIKKPFTSESEIIGKVNINDESVVTSGIYERYITINDTIYHHILNPFTGYPADNELESVTIVSNKSIDGDALSTFIFIEGLEGGFGIVENMDNVEAIFVTKDKKIYITSGMKQKFEVTKSEYELLEKN